MACPTNHPPGKSLSPGIHESIRTRLGGFFGRDRAKRLHNTQHIHIVYRYNRMRPGTGNALGPLDPLPPRCRQGNKTTHVDSGSGITRASRRQGCLLAGVHMERVLQLSHKQEGRMRQSQAWILRTPVIRRHADDAGLQSLRGRCAHVAPWQPPHRPRQWAKQG